MNKVFLIGRAVKDTECRYTQGDEPIAVANYTLAVNRRGKNDEADFIRCVAFGKSAEFAEKYIKKGTKMAVVGRIQTGSYKKDDQTHYTTDVIVEEQEFAQAKGDSEGKSEEPKSADGFMDIPDSLVEELPFV